MIKLYKFEPTEEQITEAGVLHIPASARENPQWPAPDAEEFADQLLLAMSTPISDEDTNTRPVLPRICYCPGDDTNHEVSSRGD